jgi:hypothetical protein
VKKVHPDTEHPADTTDHSGRQRLFFIVYADRLAMPHPAKRQA